MSESNTKTVLALRKSIHLLQRKRYFHGVEKVRTLTRQKQRAGKAHALSAARGSTALQNML